MRLRTHANPFSIRKVEPRPWDEVFGRTAPFLVEIGFGRGDLLLELAAHHPEWDIVGLEIRPALVEFVTRRAARRGLTNLSALLANAQIHLPVLFPPGGLAGILLLFPDPWFKRRQRKRRILQPGWASSVETLLAPGGFVDVQTDQEELAREAEAVLGRRPGWCNAAGAGELISPRLPVAPTRRARMHASRGATIWRMRYGLSGDPPPVAASPADDPVYGFAYS